MSLGPGLSEPDGLTDALAPMIEVTESESPDIQKLWRAVGSNLIGSGRDTIVKVSGHGVIDTLRK